MQILIDTNVMLDVLLNREAFVKDAVNLLKLPEDEVQKFVSASAITDIHYIAQLEIRNKAKVKELLRNTLKIVRVAGVSENDILEALNSNWTDFEDSVQNAVAESHNYDAVVTRNKKDYKKSKLQVFSPTEFLKFVKNKSRQS